MMISRIRKLLAKAAMFVFLLTVSPTVYAMSEMESREMRRVAIVQMVTVRSRRRALDRRYGRTDIIKYKFEFVN
jgi:hypothetical protein